MTIPAADGPQLSRRTFTASTLGALTAGALTSGALTSGVLGAGLPSVASAAGRRPPSFDEVTLWDAELDPLENYHVHGLAVLPGDVILAATEGRYEVCDAGPRDLLLRRSLDGGDSWQPTQVLVKSIEGQSWGNPAFVVDSETGTVFCFYMLSIRLDGNTTCSGDRGDLFVISSDDDGATWSEPRDLSGMFEHFPYQWALHGPGPGHGIQLAGGRLLINVSHRRIILGTPANERYYGVSAIYSDDHGATWVAGAEVPVSLDYPLNEARLVQRSDGTVLINARASSGGNRQRIVAISPDGGETWSDPKLDGATGVFNAVDASLVRYTGGPGSDELSRILFARPDAPVRRNLTVSVSYDEANSLWFSRVITPERSYYCDLARLSDGTIIALYGCDGDIPSFPRRVALARFNLEWLTRGRDGLAEPLAYRERVISFAATRRVAGVLRPTKITDPIARRGTRVHVDGAASGQFVEYEFASDPGDYRLQLRYFRPLDGAAFEVSLNGKPLPVATAFDSTGESAPGYEPAYLGTVRLARGANRIRITVTGAGCGGGTALGLDSLSLIKAPAPDRPTEVIIDNVQLGWELVSGTWGTSAAGTQGAWSSNYRHHPAGTGSSVVRWTPVIPATGRYRIQSAILPFPNRATNAPFTLHRAGRPDETVRIDQRQHGTWDPRGTEWQTLGEFDLDQGLSTMISLSDDADGYVAADAIRWERIE